MPSTAKPKSGSANAADAPLGFYYGWIVVVAAAAAMAATLPGRTHGLGLVTKPLLLDLHLGQTAFGHMNLWATLLGAAFCLPCGWMIDRVGVRAVLTGVLAALAAAVVLLSRVSDPTELFLTVTLTRGFGQSMLSVVSITMVGKWFQRRLGPAMGAYSVAMSIMMASSTGLIGREIGRLGWRGAWLELGIAVGVLAPLAWLTVRNGPRDPAFEFDAAPQAEADPRNGATLGQALATPCFWVFALSISFFGMVSAGLSLFNQFVLEERGFSERVFYRVVIIGMLSGMTANLVTGWLSRSLPLQRLLSASLLLLAAALGFFPFLRTAGQVYAYAVVYGIAGGMLTVMFFAVWGHAFGSTHLGRIQAVAQMLTVFASAGGPLLVAEARDYTGSYVQIFSASAIAAGILGWISWMTPVPSARAGVWDSPALAVDAA